MPKSELIGALALLPALLLAAGICVYLAYARLVCDPLYEAARLYDMSVLAEVKRSVHDDLGGAFDPPPRPAIAVNPDLSFGRYCR